MKFIVPGNFKYVNGMDGHMNYAIIKRRYGLSNIDNIKTFKTDWDILKS